ncbi:IlvN-domain-containing protein [Phascolomyces articulosus]|uniref:Acetohydroxy-acid reductoisomerase n=1 Tax=Phascolomyces articulosus TaxID=60185 RepID=A0AAD5KBA6_9FUNG|nr:IlvN-domain-containing protein [Phascolomyces articulosus]
MAVKVYHDSDADLSIIQNKRVTFVGFGNQGSAQAQNLRDSGVKNITIGNRDDDYKPKAEAAGFTVKSISEAVKDAEVIFLLIPDEVQHEVWKEQIKENVADNATLVVASGYAYAFDLLELPANMSVVMAAPRMIGPGVRDRYVAKEPYPCFVSVEKDPSDNALPVVLSIARAIGATLGGAVESSCREEAGIDLFAEQALWPAINTCFREAFNTLKAAGFSDEAILHDMYLSKEPAEVFDRAATVGFFRQLKFHSPTSQFGQLRGTKNNDGTALRAKFEKVLHEDILSGEFAKFWSGAFTSGSSDLEQLWKESEDEPISQAEKRIGLHD